MVQKKLPTINSAHGTETRNILNKVIEAINDRGLEILSESGFLTWLEKNEIKVLKEVQSISNLPASDAINTIRGVLDDNKLYIKKNDGWVAYQTIDINKINDVERKVEAISHVAPLNTFSNIADGINAMYQTLPEGAWMKIPAGTHDFDKKIVLNRQINVDFSGALMNYVGSSNDATIEIGKETDWTRYFRIEGLEVRRPRVNMYTNAGEIGIRVINVAYSKIDLSAWHFTTGVELTAGNNIGNVYNQYNLGFLYNNKESLTITTFDSTGWTNENNFYGGGFSFSSDVGTSEHTHLNIEYNGYTNNNHRFYGTSFEDGSGEGYAFKSEGNGIYFFAPRFEGAKKVYMGENSRSNVILYGYGSSTLELSGEISHLNRYGNNYTEQRLGSRGLKYNLETGAGTAFELDNAGRSIFSITNQGDISGRFLKIASRIDFNYDKAFVITDDIENAPYTQGSIFSNVSGGLEGLKFKAFGGVDNLSGWRTVQLIYSTSTGLRPSSATTGYTMFDTTLGQPIWWNGTGWVDAMGTQV